MTTTSIPGVSADTLPLDIVIFSSYRSVVPHFETELDIAQQHLDRGDRVVVVQCEGELNNCEFNPEKDPSVCENCVGRRRMGASLLSGIIAIETFQTDHAFPADLQTRFESVQQLIDYQWNGVDIGYAALSSLVSFCRDPDPDLQQYQSILESFIIAAWQSYAKAKSLLAERPVDRVYVYNGRFAAMRPILRACQQSGVDCFLHERGCDGQHFELLKNHLPHDLEMIETIIRERWANADAQEREQIGASWFHERLNRVEKVWHSFTKNQQVDRLPANWNSGSKNITIFCSSDDEFVAIGDAWKNDIYPNQVDAIAQIVQDMREIEPATQIYLRMHPNLTGVDNDRCRRMKNLSSPNLTVILPDAKVDTYRLVRESDTVVTFGSSVGAEAVFWGTPSVLLGPCYYQNLGGVYRVNAHADTLELLTQTLQPGDTTGSLMYGYWFQTRGYPHRYFEATGLFEGVFRGETIYAKPPPRPRRIKRWLQRLKRFISTRD